MVYHSNEVVFSYFLTLFITTLYNDEKSHNQHSLHVQDHHCVAQRDVLHCVRVSDYAAFDAANFQQEVCARNFHFPDADRIFRNIFETMHPTHWACEEGARKAVLVVFGVQGVNKDHFLCFRFPCWTSSKKEANAEQIHCFPLHVFHSCQFHSPCR